MYDPLSSLFCDLLPKLTLLQASLRQNQLAENLSLQQLIQIGQEIKDQQNTTVVPNAGVCSRDIAPDGYQWKKYGQKSEGRDRLKSYFRCLFPNCEAKRFVSYNKETGQMVSVYFNSHCHEGCILNQQTANSYEEYLAIVARIQQFCYSDQVKNGFGETFSDKVSLEFPSRIPLQKVEFVRPSKP